MQWKVYLLASFLILAAGKRRIKEKPPEPRYPAVLGSPVIAADVSESKRSKEDEGYEWERSGLMEGDIVATEEEMRNAVVEPERRWSGYVPVYINETDFDPDEVRVIEKGMHEIERKTCVKFRPYENSDKSFIVVRGNSTGCWSSVGRKDGGQILHLQTPNCVRHGIVVHEFLHALGFYHQQSSHERDDYIRIEWQNIEPGREHNFRKYDSTTVMNYDLPYDYTSIMHYSKKAFSKNGEHTITPLKENVTLGQRKGMSQVDILKVQHMYRCNETAATVSPPEDGDYGTDFDNLLY